MNKAFEKDPTPKSYRRPTQNYYRRPSTTRRPPTTRRPTTTHFTTTTTRRTSTRKTTTSIQTSITNRNNFERLPLRKRVNFDIFKSKQIISSLNNPKVTPDFFQPRVTLKYSALNGIYLLSVTVYKLSFDLLLLKYPWIIKENPNDFLNFMKSIYWARVFWVIPFIFNSYLFLISPGKSRNFCNPNSDTWRDRLGSSCAQYLSWGWCTTEGGYGPNWKPLWKKFENYLTDDFDARNCPQCGCQR